MRVSATVAQMQAIEKDIQACRNFIVTQGDQDRISFGVSEGSSKFVRVYDVFSLSGAVEDIVKHANPVKMLDSQRLEIRIWYDLTVGMATLKIRDQDESLLWLLLPDVAEAVKEMVGSSMPDFRRRQEVG